MYFSLVRIVAENSAFHYKYVFLLYYNKVIIKTRLETKKVVF